MRRWRTGAGDAGERDQDQEPNVTVLLEDIDQDNTAEDSENQQARSPSRRHRRPFKAPSLRAVAVGAGPADQDRGQGRTAGSTAQPPGTDRKDGGRPKWVRGLLAEPPRGYRADAEREAALDLRESKNPAMQQLLLNVPGSTTPEEAGTFLAQRAGLDYATSPDAKPTIILDLPNTADIGTYPDRDKLSNRVLRRPPWPRTPAAPADQDHPPRSSPVRPSGGPRGRKAATRTAGTAELTTGRS